MGSLSRRSDNTRRRFVGLKKVQALADSLAQARMTAVEAITGPGKSEAQQALAEARQLHDAVVVAGRVQMIAMTDISAVEQQ